MTLWNHYHLAQNLPDALHALQRLPQPARLVAGGTDLLLELQQGRVEPVQTLVDITTVPELKAIEIRCVPQLGDCLFVGAGIPLSHIAQHPLIWQHGAALVDACQLIGGPQVRNCATLGGNVAHALPAADGSIALLALDARAEVAALDGSTIVPLVNLFQGPGKSALKVTEQILVGFYLPLLAAGEASAFQRVMRPQGVALPVLNMACWVQCQDDQILEVRLAIGPSGTVPYRARSVEQRLRNRPYSPAVLEAAGQVLLDSAHFRTSPRRASAAYRQHLAQILLPAVFRVAWERAASARHQPIA